MKVLVTAFKPFNNLTQNFSMEVLNHLTNVEKVVLDVLYDESYFELKRNYNLDSYDLIIAMGEARMRNELTLELFAKNISSCSLADNNKVLKKNEIIKHGLPEILKTGVDVSKVENLIKFSEDAGKFVCNNIYFHLLSEYSNKAIFIHIPDCSSDDMIHNCAIRIIQLINKLI